VLCDILSGVDDGDGWLVLMILVIRRWLLLVLLLYLIFGCASMNVAINSWSSRVIVVRVTLSS